MGGTEMTMHERMTRMYEHTSIGRQTVAPSVIIPWQSTLEW